MENGIFAGTAYHTRLVPHPNRFKVPIGMELLKWEGDDVPEKAREMKPDAIWRLSTIKYLGYDYSPILFYLLYSKTQNLFYHVFIHTPSLDGVYQCYDFSLHDNRAKTDHIKKTGDISPLGVQLTHGNHSYTFVFESDFKNYFFVHIDTFVNKQAHIKCVMKVKRERTPSIRNYFNGTSWVFKIRTFIIAFVLYIHGQLIEIGWSKKGINMKTLLNQIENDVSK